MLVEEWLQFAVAANRDIEAPCDDVWKLLSNMSDLASVFSGVAKVEEIVDKGGCKIDDDVSENGDSRDSLPKCKVAISPGGPTTIGSQWRVHRHLDSGERFFADWAVTRIDDGPKYPKSIVFYTTNMMREGSATATSTWTVQPAQDEDGRISSSACNVTMTLAVVPHQMYLIAGRLMCCCVFKKRGIMAIERDLDDVASTAKDRNTIVQ